MGRLLGFAVFVDPSQRHRQVDIMRLPFIAVIPRAVDPPGIVKVITEQKGILRQFRGACHMPHEFQTEITVNCRPGRIGRRQQIEPGMIEVEKRHRIGRVIDTE